MKTNIFFAGAAALALAACSGDKDDASDSGDTGTDETETETETETDTETETETDTETTDTDTAPTDLPDYTGPTLVTYAEVSCDASDTLTYYAETIGWTTGITVDAADTANASNWNDYHNLATVSFADDKSLEVLEVNLATGATPADWETDVSTVFTCDFIDGNVMSYIYATYDESGAQSDCIYFGDDGAGFANGDYRNFGVASSADHSGCVSLN